MFSVRQIHCFLDCKSLIQEGKYALAYHELYDFIEDYGRKKELLCRFMSCKLLGIC